MNLCSSGHKEVCYECRDCPVCEAMSDTEDRDKDNNKLQDEIDQQKDVIEDLQRQLSEVESAGTSPS